MSFRRLASRAEIVSFDDGAPAAAATAFFRAFEATVSVRTEGPAPAVVCRFRKEFGAGPGIIIATASIEESERAAPGVSWSVTSPRDNTWGRVLTAAPSGVEYSGRVRTLAQAHAAIAARVAALKLLPVPSHAVAVAAGAAVEAAEAAEIDALKVRYAS